MMTKEEIKEKIRVNKVQIREVGYSNRALVKQLIRENEYLSSIYERVRQNG